MTADDDRSSVPSTDPRTQPKAAELWGDGEREPEDRGSESALWRRAHALGQDGWRLDRRRQLQGTGLRDLESVGGADDDGRQGQNAGRSGSRGAHAA